MIETFTYEALPIRVRFGRGTVAEVGAEVARLGAQRALVLTTPQQAGEGERIGGLIGEACAGVFPGATMHTPVEVTEQALAALKAADADCVVALGGGSTTGLGKALALRTGVPQLVIPTTYAGSEMTPILGETQEGRKTTIRSLDVLPEAVIYDVDLTLTLPPGLSATSGVNAIAHAVEALYARDRNPVISLMAEDGIRTLSSALPILIHEPANIEARTMALYGAWLCGCCLGAVGMRCTTSSATRSAAPSICPTRRPTPSSSPTRWPTTRPPRRRPWRPSRGPSARRMRRRGCSIWCGRWACRARCQTSACRRTASRRPLTSPCKTLTGTRVR